MGEFNSDDHYIYYCGQESHRINGVAIIVNKHSGLINDYMKAFMGFLLAGGAEFSNQLDNMAIVGFEIKNNHFVILCG